ncbi:hypothetical protein NQ176_g1928 [Zarea fungicola]|uniref:Uncharacterized protein n=1 Tax=Zarea fungicola TaxID=93591 RepID=A0ACC1NS24_9HYPO|nr:hypothetical protein NQ176_g1928 [Lecanicillium fungicola]
MLITHGVLSRDAVPAVGLVPLAISTVAGITLLRHKNKLQAQSADGQEGSAAGAAGGHNEIGAVESVIAELDPVGDRITHPLAVFAFDIAIAASIMVVLVYTWKSSSTSASLSMLAAYATIPLMLSFISHVALAFSALWDGLAIHGHIKWAASRAIDSDCPNCSHSLWPDRPTMPWSRFFQGRNQSAAYTPLFADGAESYHSDDDAIRGFAAEPEAVDVRPKKNGRNKPTSIVDETTSLLP